MRKPLAATVSVVITVWALAIAAIAAQTSIYWNFDQILPGTFHSQWAAPELVPGVHGNALRTDGFSTWMEGSAQFDGSQFLGGTMWVALESYPSDREVPAQDLTPSSFLNQATHDGGFDLYIDTFGRWGLRLMTPTGWKCVTAPSLFPLYRWTKIGFSVDTRNGRVQLLQDGKIVAAFPLNSVTKWIPASAPLIMGKSWRDAKIGIFRVNALDGAFDDVSLTQDADHFAQTAMNYERPAVSVNASLAVPASRFSEDHLRPRFHALPAANWTNEPHGMVLANDRFHLFYQRTPNGPFKQQMHWGHMSSTDLINWDYQRDALYPSLQTDSDGFDMKGIWSGDVIVERGTAYAFYTSVNHGRQFNPAISLAVSTDPHLDRWDKRGPIMSIPGVSDFRDPFLWSDGNAWNMLIGASYDGRGGLAYYRCEPGGKPTCWRRMPNFSSVPYGAMDAASAIWEMPIFVSVGDKYALVVNPIGRKVSKYGDPATRSIYWLGKWQNGSFVPDTAAPQMLDIVPGHLSPTVVRDQHGTVVGIGIVDERRNAVAQMAAGWAHTFSIPREWFITPNGKSLGQRSLDTLQTLRDQSSVIRIPSMTFSGAHALGNVGFQSELVAHFHADAVGAYGVTLAKSPDGKEFTQIYYDPLSKEIVVDKRHSSLSDSGEGPQVLRGTYNVAAFGEPLDWHVFVDGSVVDVFLGNGGAFSFRIYPTQRDASEIGIMTSGSVTLDSAELWRLKPASFSYWLDE